MAYAQSGDTRIWYESFGSGEPLLLIMGLSGTVQSWGLQIPELSRHYRLICLDNRGAGRSDMPPGPYSIEAMADDALAELDAAGVDAAHVLGVSMGGLIAQALYHRQPARVHSLILGCTGTGPQDACYIPPAPHVWEILQLDRAVEPPEQVVEAMVRMFYHPSYRARVPDLVERLLHLQRNQPQPPHAYAAQLGACRNHQPCVPGLRNIQVPTLVLHGDEDEIWPLANAQHLAAHIPAAELIVIPDSGHMFMIEKPREFNQAVLDFLSRQAPAWTAAG
jgi:pimeloyl-ACP methyl ester carboxylesterase